MYVGVSHEEFTIELDYGAFFCWVWSLKELCDGKISCFGNCEVDTWSILWLDDFIEQLGYTKTHVVKTYWLLPGKDLAIGLSIIGRDSDTKCALLWIGLKLWLYIFGP